MRVRGTGEGDIALPNTSLERPPRSRPNRRKAPWSEQLRGGAAQLEAVRQTGRHPDPKAAIRRCRGGKCGMNVVPIELRVAAILLWLNGIGFGVFCIPAI